MSKDAYYFSHDANARHDPKILAMRSDYGIKGYGIYWVVVEMLREEESYKLPFKNYIWNAIAMQVQCNDFTKDDAKLFVETCINDYELFDSDDDFFWSNSLLRRMEKKSDLSEKRRAAAKTRWGKVNNDAVSDDEEKKTDANAMQMDANAKQDDAIKEKESKVNKSKKIYYAESVSLLPSEYQKLVDVHGEVITKRMIETLDNYKGANGKKYKSDYKAMLSWVRDKVLAEQNKVTHLRPKVEPQGRVIPKEFNFDTSAGEDC